jgi:hypothetical protein
MAAVFGVFSIEHKAHEFAALGSIVFLALGFAATVILAIVNPNRDWYDLRALAESTKSLSWLFAVGGGDFEKGKRREPAISEDFAQRSGELRDRLGKGLKTEGDAPVAITSAMQELRAKALAVRRQAYLKDRLADQKTWYTNRARTHSHARTGWVLASGALQVTGFTLALLRFFEVVHIDLVGIATTAAVAAAAWLRANDHSGVAEAYRQTAYELGEIEATIDDAADEAEWATWVASAETALSREHTSWSARRRIVLD